MTPLFNGREFVNLSAPQSPLTGLGREHWISVANHLLRSSEHLTSSTPWLYHYPGPTSSNGPEVDGLEGFARTLLLASFRLAAGGVDDTPTWLLQLQKGLSSGAEALKNRAHGAWPHIEPHSQSLVEAASIASALVIARHQLWDPLPLHIQDSLASWLDQALVPQVHLNNWAFFPAVTAAALGSLGYESKRASTLLAELPGVIDDWSLSDGWYSDGPGTRIDYYNAWAFHYYLPLIAHLSDDKGLVDLARSRIEAFLESFLHFFSVAGAPVYFGRSLTYRFASVSPMWTSQLIGAHSVDPGILRSTASQVLKYFAANGAMADGTLSVGWHGENAELAQGYSSAASPLWSAKAFIGLLLGPTHPAWMSREAELAPPRQSAAIQLSSSAGFVVSNSTPSGISKLHLAGVAKWPSWAPQSRLPDPLYDRMSYSSVTAPYAGDDVPENSVAVSSGSTLTRPAAAHVVQTSENWISSRSRLWGPNAFRFPPTYRWGRVTKWVKRAFAPEPWRRATLSILTVLRGDVELRIYRVTGAPPLAKIQVGWYAVSGTHSAKIHKEISRVFLPGITCSQDVALLSPGWELALEPRSDASNPFGTEVHIPVAAATLDSRGSAVLGAAIRLSSAAHVVPPLSSFELSQTKNELRITDSTTGEWCTIRLEEDLLLPTDWRPAEPRRQPQ